MPVTQYDAKMIESSGLVKADILGLKTLSAVTDAAKIIKQSVGKDYLQEDDMGLALLYRLPEDSGVYKV
jgi:DNA polymerase III alpha subunit